MRKAKHYLFDTIDEGTNSAIASVFELCDANEGTGKDGTIRVAKELLTTLCEFSKPTKYFNEQESQAFLNFVTAISICLATYACYNEDKSQKHKTILFWLVIVAAVICIAVWVSLLCKLLL